MVVTTLARRHVPRCNLAGDKGGVRWNKAPRWLAGKETSFSYIRGHGQTTSFITHWPFDHRNTLAIRPTVRASFPLSPRPSSAPFQQPLSTAFASFVHRVGKKNPSSSFHRIFSNRSDPDRLIENSKRKRKIQGFFLFFFFFTLRVRRASPLPIDTEKSGWHRRLRVTKSHPPNPWIERVVVHTSCRLFNDARGVRTIGPNWRKLFLFFRGFYTEI